MVIDGIGCLKGPAQRCGFELSEGARKTDSTVRPFCSRRLVTIVQKGMEACLASSSVRQQTFSSRVSGYHIGQGPLLEQSHPLHPVHVQNLTHNVRNAVEQIKARGDHGFSDIRICPGGLRDSARLYRHGR
jgi:hypothetical protein